MGDLRNTKSLTQLLEGPMPLDNRIAVMASATLPKTLLELISPKGTL
jgi:hypothetical protein